MTFKLFAGLCLIPSLVYGVFIETDGLKVHLGNGIMEYYFDANGTATSIMYDGVDMVNGTGGGRTFYLDWHVANGSSIRFKPTSVTVVDPTYDRAHFFWTQPSDDERFRTELHYSLSEGLSGIRSWIKFVNDRPLSLTMTTTRTVYRFDPFRFTRGTNGVYSGQLLSYSYLRNQTEVQDETWQLPDGSYYTKYDFANYIRETPWQGVYGNGYGVFLISASREYHNGGPLKQELLVHQDALLLNVLLGPHFGTFPFVAPPGWSHIYGPFLLYFARGSEQEILDSVANRTQIEKNAWPYSEVEDPEYPIKRGSVGGQITGQTRATVVLWDSPTERFDAQSLGYTFSADTEHDGTFEIENIRPGEYQLAAYPLAGHGSDNLATRIVTVPEGSHVDVGTIELPEPGNILWNIGEADRRSSEFKYSNQTRNYEWQLLPPADLVFTIGRSDPEEDWYFAQTKPGNWTVRFDDTKDEYGRTLRIAFAAFSRDENALWVWLNGQKLARFEYDNDKTVYRSALQSGEYHSSVLDIDSDKVISGVNELTFELIDGQLMYDAISWQRGK